MQKFMWIVLLIALLALVLSVFSLYRITRLTNGKSLLPDISALISQADPSTKNPDDTVASEYQPVLIEELWENRGDLSGKKIELATELDTDTMMLQPTPFPNPITLKKPDLVSTNKDTWIRNQGKQTVVIQGVFYLHLAMGEDGERTESYSMVVDRMVQKLDAKQFYIWPDKKTPTEEVDTRLFSTFDTETLMKLEGKPITYVGVYTVESGVGMLDRKLVVTLSKMSDTVLLNKLSQGDVRVRVRGVLRLEQGLHGPVYSLEVGEIEILTDVEQE